MFGVSNQGFSQLLLHADGSKHKKATSNMKNQAVFTVPSSSASTVSKLVLTNSKHTPISLSEKILKAEIFLVLTAIKNNYSFASLTDLSQIYSEIFEDSDIAKGLKLSDKKVRYMLNFGLAPYFKSFLFKDIAASYYVIHFDETTTKQVKKQLDIHLSYWSETNGKTVISYCESHFLGHADADKLLKLMLNFIENNDLSVEKLLQLSMDGPNVNLSLHQKLNNMLSKKSLPPLLNIGTCYLHVMHNALRKGIEKLEFDIDKFALDVHQWFRLSPARKEDFHSLQVELLDGALANHVFLRHVESRWLTLGPVCDRLIEQYSIMEKYFLKVIAAHYEDGTLERYNRIVSCLKDPFTIVHLHYISYLSGLFKPLMLLLQKETPIIHILYGKLNELLRSIFLKFMKTKIVGDNKGFQLTDIDPEKGENWVDRKKMEIGYAATNAVNGLDLEQNSFYLSIRSCYIAISKYLLQKLPITNPILNDLQCLSPLNRNRAIFKRSASRLPEYLPQICKTVSMIDRLNEEWLLYMCDDDIANFTNAYNMDHNICNYWHEISKIKDCSGNLKYPKLSAVAKVCLILSPANAQPERGFSVNNNIVTKDRSSLSDLCINSIRICKDAIRLHDYNIPSIKITRQLLDTVKKSHAEYSAYMEQQKEKLLQPQKKREADEQTVALAKAKKIKLLELEDKFTKLLDQKKNLLDDQNAAQKLLNEASVKLTKAVNEQNMGEVKIAQMMLSAANNEITSVHSKLIECSGQQGQLKLQLFKSNK